MCTKHTACCSDKISAPATISSCSPATPKAVKAEASASGCCSSSSCCETVGETPPDEDEPLPGASHSFSWYVAGMDCPSCAQKVETAVNAVEGVTESQVRFATQKLIVSGNSGLRSADIEAAVQAIGFKLESASGIKTSAGGEEGWQARLKRNALLISLTVAMALSAVVSRFEPQLAGYLFTLVCLAGLAPVARKAWLMGKSGTPFSIETLMTTAALGALYLGESTEAAMVLLLFLLGERLEAYAAGRARTGVKALMELVPETATLVENGQRRIVPAGELKPGDQIEVAAGDRLPADGVLTQGCASLDESALTGESVPVEKQAGEKVMAGSVVADATVLINVTSLPGQNAIDRILHLIEEADSRKAPLERFLDRFSRWYTPLMMLVALLVIVTPPLLFAQPWETWLYRGLALLLIACPCALVISTPAAITSGLATAARHGVLIKGGAALEQLGSIESVAFDKTGTLTEGRPKVTDIRVFNDWSESELLRFVASVESGSRHPLAVSLVKHATQQGIDIPFASDTKALPGAGIRGQVEGREVVLLAPDRCQQALGAEEEAEVRGLEQQGKTLVVAMIDDCVAGLVAWRDTLRSDARQAVQELNDMGIATLMLTGDNPVSAQAMAEKTGVSFKAGLLPEDKVNYVEALSAQKQVAMVGDGINDAPAMKAASVGIAMGGGTDVALETADAALTHNRLAELPFMIRLSKSTLKIIRQNVTLALGLKGVFLVTSLFGITGLWMAVLADSGATALVTLNSLRLLREKRKEG